jgi:hypothetical protein
MQRKLDFTIEIVTDCLQASTPRFNARPFADDRGCGRDHRALPLDARAMALAEKGNSVRSLGENVSADSRMIWMRGLRNG